MSLTEKDLIRHNWDELEEEAVVKQVATKGKYINMALAYLAQRLDASAERAKEFFTAEVDRYVIRLLANHQVYKAEHVLRNVNRDPRFLFFEFAKLGDISDTTRQIIIDHLRKCVPNFTAQIDELEFDLHILDLCQKNRTMKLKYSESLRSFSLEALNENGRPFRNMLIVDVVLSVKPDWNLKCLDKNTTWTYFLANELFTQMVKWLDIQYDAKTGTYMPRPNQSFQAKLEALYASWPLDDQMIISVIHSDTLLSEELKFSLARHSIFTMKERKDVQRILHRIFTSESWKENCNLIESQKFLTNLIRIILSEKLTFILNENFITLDAIKVVENEFPHLTDEINLCKSLKQVSLIKSSDLAIVSKATSTYIQERVPDFYTNNPSLYFIETLLSDVDLSVILQSNEMKALLVKIPFIESFLHKLETSTDIVDHNLNVFDLVKQTRKVDLKQITVDAEDDELNFANKSLILKYSQPNRLGFNHYLNQRRGAFAVYTFMMDQLQDYAQITNRQIMVACGSASELAVNNFEDNELVTHCMAFIEMLGVDSTLSRAYIKCLKRIHFTNPHLIVRNMTETEILKAVESALIDDWNEGRFELCDFEALCLVLRALCIPLPIKSLENIALTSNWFQFLVFASYFKYPIGQVVKACESFGDRNMGKNISRSIGFNNPSTKRRPRKNSTLSTRERRKKMSVTESNSVTSAETMSSSISSTETITTSKLDASKYLTLNENSDLYAVILQCNVDGEQSATEMDSLDFAKFLNLYRNPQTVQKTTQLNLLRVSVMLKWPILTVLAATVQPNLRKYCWLVWLIISIDYPELNEHLDCFQIVTTVIIEYCILNGFSQTVHQSIQIFYPHSNICHFTDYFRRIEKFDFSPDTMEILKTYLIAVNDDTVQFECLNINSSDSLNFSINLLISHLSVAFKSIEQQRILLEALCDAGINDFIDTIDMIRIKALLRIVSFTSVSIHLDRLRRDKFSDSDIIIEYEQICGQLMNEKEFQKAMKIADLVNIPKEGMIYENWMWNYYIDENFDFDKCEEDAEINFGLAPNVLIGFYMDVTEKLTYEDPKKYQVLKKVLDVIKKHHLFPNEIFNRDQIEYEMIVSFLKNPFGIDQIQIYHSEYYECIMMNERNVLYKTFLELKEIAGVDELTVASRITLDDAEMSKLDTLFNQLLDNGDIVEALRVQAIIGHRPLDLHYIVFCMALSEGLATLSDLTTEQRQMLTDGAKLAMSRFNRRTLKTSTSSSPPKPSSAGIGTSSDNSGLLDFEEIPSREKQDILEALQCLAAQVNHGAKIAQRIALTWRAAMYLDKEYVDVLKTKDPLVLLQNAIDEDCLQKLVVMNDVMTSTEMSDEEIASFLAQQISASIIKSRFYIIQNKHQQHHHQQQQQQSSPQLPTPPINQNLLWGFNLDKDFRMFLELCPSTSTLGNYLLKYCDALKIYRRYDLNDANVEPDLSQEDDEMAELFVKLRMFMEDRMLSHKKQNTITVELLIKAHDCFVHECYMEGISVVLQKTKLLNSVLANAKSWNLIVKMVIGIGRYRDMYYCFETLIANDQFESLLGQFDDDHINGLKQGILSYLQEHCPENTEFFRLAALHFMMYKKIAELWETEANSGMAKILAQNEVKQDDSDVGATNGDQTIIVQYLKCGAQIVGELTNIMESYAHATENYLLDDKMTLAQRSANHAELIALQINLVNCALEAGGKDRCICILNIRSASLMKYIVNNELSVPQSMILDRNYPFEINWPEAIFNQYILLERTEYLSDYCDRMELTECIIESIVKSFQYQTNITPSMEQSISTLIEMIESVTLRYKLASLLGLKKIIAHLINSSSIYFLKDTNYGRNEILL